MRLNRDTFFGALMGAAILLTGLLLGGWHSLQAQDDEVSQILKTQRLVIVDELGTELMILGGNAEGGALSVRNRFGREVIVGGATQHGGTVAVVHSRSGQPVVVNRADERGGRTEVLTTAGKTAAELRSNLLAGELKVSGHEGKPVASIGATAGGRGRIQTTTPEGKPLVLLTATTRDEGQIYTFNATGNPQVALANSVDGPVLQLLNRFGEVAVSLESDAQGNGSMKALGRDGTVEVLEPSTDR